MSCVGHMATTLPINPDSVPMGATVVADKSGVTFRCWAPRAKNVWISGSFNGWKQNPQTLLNKRGSYWVGFVAGVSEKDTYKFYIEGEGTSGFKRDPYARELTFRPGYPYNDCIVRDPRSYPWRDQGYRTPAFNDLIIYQLHIGVFYGPNIPSRAAKFLDVLRKLEYLVALGINALQLLPVVEFSNSRSMGYEGADIFSPEMDYTVGEDGIDEYLTLVNDLLRNKGKGLLDREDLVPQNHQLKAFIDVCHAYGIAVMCDVVYNHAGGQIKGQSESIWFFDRAAGTHPNDSLYFTDRDHTGPVWAIWKQEVRQFLIDNAASFVTEYHIDGLRYDQVSVIVSENRTNGWGFSQDLTDTVRYVDPSVVQIAEYWNVDPYVVRFRQHGGAGFDACYHDGLRSTIRGAIEAASAGGNAFVNMEAIAENLWAPNFLNAWRAVHYLESHDEVYAGRGKRIAALADPGNSRSWPARSRARVATGLILTAPGIPMLFMGQEFLEDKQWHDDAGKHPNLLLWWDGLDGGIDREMTFHLQFVQSLVHIRRSQSALRSETLNVIHTHNANRVLAFHRWIPGEGRDVVVVASLNDTTFFGYEVGFPSAGGWNEILNSEYHNASNGGRVEAFWSPLHNMPATARLTIPANSIIIFTL